MKAKTFSMTHLMLTIIDFAHRILDADMRKTVSNGSLAATPYGKNHLNQRIQAVAAADWIAYHVHENCFLVDVCDAEGNHEACLNSYAHSLLWIEYTIDGKYDVALVAFFESAEEATTEVLKVAYWEAQGMPEGGAKTKAKKKTQANASMPSETGNLLVAFWRGVEDFETSGFRADQNYELYDGTQRKMVNHAIWDPAVAACPKAEGESYRIFSPTTEFLETAFIDRIEWRMKSEVHSREALEVAYLQWLVEEQGMTPAEAQCRLLDGGLERQEENADRGFLRFLFRKLPLTDDVPLVMWRCDTEHVLEWRALNDRKVRFVYIDEDDFPGRELFPN